MSWTLTSRRAFPGIRHRAVGSAAFAFLIAALPVSSRLMGQSGSGSNPAITGELVLSGNHHYFSDGNGHVVLLAGSQTWNTLKDWGTDGTAESLDFAQLRSSQLSWLSREDRWQGSTAISSNYLNEERKESP